MNVTIRVPKLVWSRRIALPSRSLLAGTTGFVVLVLSACAAPFSEMQSARLAGVGRTEITPTFTRVSAGSSDGSANVQTQFGLHAAIGISSRVDIRARYERIQLTGSDFEEDAGGTNVLAVGPKFSLVQDRLSVYVPIGMALGGGIETSETMQVHPTLLFTIPLAQQVDINSSLKALVPLASDNGDPLVAVNLGVGLSTADRRWTVRPEFGLLRKPNESGHFRHFSIGLTRGFDR